MNGFLIVQGLIELLISIITGVIIFFISIKIFSIITKNINQIDEINQIYAIMIKKSIRL